MCWLHHGGQPLVSDGRHHQRDYMCQYVTMWDTRAVPGAHGCPCWRNSRGLSGIPSGGKMIGSPDASRKRLTSKMPAALRHCATPQNPPFEPKTTLQVGQTLFLRTSPKRGKRIQRRQRAGNGRGTAGRGRTLGRPRGTARRRQDKQKSA